MLLGSPACCVSRPGPPPAVANRIASGGSDGACYGQTQPSGNARGSSPEPVRAQRNRPCPHHPPQAGHAAQRAGRRDILAGNVRDPHDARILHGSGRDGQLLEHRRRDRSRVRTRVRGAVREHQRDRAVQPLRRQALLDDPDQAVRLQHQRAQFQSQARQRRQRHRGRARRALVCGRAEPRVRAPRNGPLHDRHHRRSRWNRRK